MPKISEKMRVAELPKKAFLWLALLCTLLQLGLNLPVSTAATYQVITSDDNNCFDLGDNNPEISAINGNALQDIVYKKELEEQQTKEGEGNGEQDTKDEESKEENQTEREEELSIGCPLFWPAKVERNSLLHILLAAKNTKISAIAIATTVLVPKYILYQQFKYHLG